MEWDTLLSLRELLFLVVGSLLGIFVGQFFLLQRIRVLPYLFFGRFSEGNLRTSLHAVAEGVEEEKRWFMGILTLLDRLGVGGAFLVPGDTRILLNEVFSRSVGLRGKGVQEVWAFEIPVFGEALLHAFSSEGPVPVPQSGFTLSPVTFGEHRLLLLEDERKKTQRLRNLRYFLTALWHELRTPLTVLSGYIGTLEGGMPVDSEVLSRMERQIHRLENTIKEMQKLSFILDGQRSPVSCETFFAILKRVIDEQRTKRGDVSLVVRAEGVDVACLLPFSEGEAFVLLTNLVANACTFSVSGGEVEITVTCGESGLFLMVANTASLPDAEFLRWFFDPTSAPPRGGSGKGVGLYLVREIVEESGGEIRLRMQGNRVALEVFLPRKESS